MVKVKLKPGPRIVEIPIELIFSNPLRPRMYYDENELYALAASIAEIGIIEPITVTPDNSNRGYIVISGERRLKAAKINDIKEIPCIVISGEKARNACFCLLSNFLSQNLNIFERATAIEKLHDRFGLSYSQIAQNMGSDEQTVLSTVRFLSIPYQLRKIIIENGLTEKHIRILLRINDDAKREQLLKHIIEEKLNVSKTEDAYKRLFFSPVKKNNNVRYFCSVSIFENTLDNTIEKLSASGLNAGCSKSENKSSIDYHIKIIKK